MAEKKVEEDFKDEDRASLRRQLAQLRMARYCLLYTSPSPRDVEESRMPSSA